MPALGLRERKKQRTRATLIDAAVELCDRQGFDRTTVDQIAAIADGTLVVDISSGWPTMKQARDALERFLVTRALAASNGNGAAAGRLIGETRYMPQPNMRGDTFHAGWSSGLKADNAFGVPLTFAGAVLQINAQRECAPGVADCFNFVSRLFGSNHPGGCHFAMADGSVRFFSQLMDVDVYRQLAVRADRLPVGTVAQ